MTAKRKKDNANMNKEGDLFALVAKEYGGDKAWLEEMASRTPLFFRGFGRLCTSVLAEGALPKRVKELILGIIYATQGFRDGAALHIKNAKDAGATDDEIAEMLAAALLSRGTRAYLVGFQAWAVSASKVKGKTRDKEVEKKESTVEDIVRYFDSTYGKPLPHVRALVKGGQGEVLRAYYEMRSFILSDTVLPRKYKECLYVAINTADRNIGAVKIHSKGALDAGADKQEVLEAMLVAIMAGGVISWVDVASVYEEL